MYYPQPQFTGERTLAGKRYPHLCRHPFRQQRDHLERHQSRRLQPPTLATIHTHNRRAHRQQGRYGSRITAPSPQTDTYRSATAQPYPGLSLPPACSCQIPTSALPEHRLLPWRHKAPTPLPPPGSGSWRDYLGSHQSRRHQDHRLGHHQLEQRVLTAATGGPSQGHRHCGSGWYLQQCYRQP